MSTAFSTTDVKQITTRVFIPDGTTSAAIQSAIDEARAAGGHGGRGVQRRRGSAVAADRRPDHVRGAAMAALQQIFLGYSAGTSYSSEALAYFAAMSSQPDDTRKGVINTLIVALKNGAVSGSNIWAKLDRLYLHGAHDSQAARLCAKTAGNVLTATNSPTFTTDRGYTGNGTNAYLNSNFTPSTAGGSFALNSASMFAWCLTNTRVNSSPILGTTHAAGPYNSINPWNSSLDNGSFGVNGGQNNFGSSPGNASGLFVATRSSSSQIEAYRNSTQLGTQSDTSTSLATTTIDILRGAAGGTTTYTDRQVMASGWGAGLTANEVTDLYNALNSYRSSIGA